MIAAGESIVDGRAHTASMPCADFDPYQQLWRRFRGVALTLKKDCQSRPECHIAVNDGAIAPSGPNVLFRVERRRGTPTKIVALTICPISGTERREAAFRVETVIVVGDSVSVVPHELLPVSYDPETDLFTIDTAPPVEELRIAEFFLDRAERLLDSVGRHSGE